jgi:hypothetical protein
MITLGFITLSPGLIVAPVICYKQAETCPQCGGTGPTRICETHYEVTNQGGVGGVPATVNGEKFCYTYSAGDTTSAPCDVPPIGNWKQRNCDGPNGSCCWTNTRAQATRTPNGTQWTPRGGSCSGGRGGYDDQPVQSL